MDFRWVRWVMNWRFLVTFKTVCYHGQCSIPFMDDDSNSWALPAKMSSNLVQTWEIPEPNGGLWLEKNHRTMAGMCSNCHGWVPEVNVCSVWIQWPGSKIRVHAVKMGVANRANGNLIAKHWGILAITKNNDGMERYRGLDMKWEATETGVEMGLTQQSFREFSING